jgi:hypothetical protein
MNAAFVLDEQVTASGGVDEVLVEPVARGWTHTDPAAPASSAGSGGDITWPTRRPHKPRSTGSQFIARHSASAFS